ncbi:MAG: hypothetical protein VYD19_00270, partial [Myxococcota bacterium]|nr:hypothetical protein [Myxococcota bacterium]
MADSKQSPLLSPLPSIPQLKETSEQAPAEGAASFDEGRAPSLDAEELAPVSEDLIESLLSAPPAPAPAAFSATLPFGAQSPLDQGTTSTG